MNINAFRNQFLGKFLHQLYNARNLKFHYKNYYIDNNE